MFYNLIKNVYGIFMILIPLTVTTQIIKCNLWTFIAFGTIYSNTLTLIHSREKHNWEDIFRYIGIGTSIDHQIHHKYLKYNYGHVFMYWDYLFDTYKFNLASINKQDIYFIYFR